MTEKPLPILEYLGPHIKRLLLASESVIQNPEELAITQKEIATAVSLVVEGYFEEGDIKLSQIAEYVNKLALDNMKMEQQRSTIISTPEGTIEIMEDSGVYRIENL